MVLDRSPYWSAQREWCAAVVRHRVVAIETGNALGKGFFVAGLALWWLFTRKDALVMITGPGQTTLGTTVFKEIRRALEGCPFHRLGLMPAKMSQGIKTSPQVVEIRPGWQVLGFSTTSIERASGQHAGELLAIVEEASGVEPEVWAAIDSWNAKRLVAIGNPIRPDGGFVDMIHEAESDSLRGVPDPERAVAFNVPSTASPHAHLDHSPWGLASRTWLDAMARRHGKDSLWYRAHVLAQRPKLSHERLIPQQHLDRATGDEAARHAAELRRLGQAGMRRISCDVGEGVGNARSVVVVRDDAGILELAASKFEGPVETARAIAELAHRWQVAPERIGYDGAGITGKKLGNSLEGVGLKGCVPYYGSGSGGKRFVNMRTACAAALARRLDPDHYVDRHRKQVVPFHIPSSPHLPAMMQELGELKVQLKGSKSALEDKQSMMERLGRSPDFADAVTASFREEAING